MALSILGTGKITGDLSWSVYPNPVQKELYFTIVDELPTSCEVITENGIVITKRISDGKIQVSDLAPGKYWIRLLVNSHIEQDLFIKN